MTEPLWGIAVYNNKNYYYYYYCRFICLAHDEPRTGIKPPTFWFIDDLPTVPHSHTLALYQIGKTPTHYKDNTRQDMLIFWLSFTYRQTDMTVIIIILNNNMTPTSYTIKWLPIFPTCLPGTIRQRPCCMS